MSANLAQGLMQFVLIGISRARNLNYLATSYHINAQQLLVKCTSVFYCIFVKIFIYFIGHHKSYNSIGNNEMSLISVKNVFGLDGIKLIRQAIIC
eukprot:UN12516